MACIFNPRKEASPPATMATDGYLQAVMNTVLDGLITIDEKGAIQMFNPAAVRIFGYQPEEVIGKNVKLLMPEPYHSEHDGYLRNYLATGENKVIGIGREVSGRRKDGSVFPMELGVNEMNVIGKRMFVGTVRDITGRKKTEEQRKKLIEKLAESNTELERFAYVASHDMQEPLRMMASFSGLIADEYYDKLDAQGQQYIGLVTEAATRMQNLVTDLLEYARVRNEGMRFEKIDTAEELKHVLENLTGMIDACGARVTCDPLPEVHGNPVQFMRLLQNLIGNGLKYQAAGSTPSAHVGVTDEGDAWCFSVRDNGIGMEPEYIGQIFEPFKRLHSWQQYEGTGIGLAVCKKIVENHGGKIWATSEPGVGSVFYFTLPKHIEEKAA